MEPKLNTLSGVLLMNKPEGFTSFDVIAKLRGILKTRKLGHGGTLDPMATGVLPVFVGGATKAADYAAAQDKEYIAGFTLGFSTDTQDTTGEKIAESDQTAALAAVQNALLGFLGTQQQIPPMYSAVQVNGQRLYELARKGVTIERPSREIKISEIELLEFDEALQKGRFRVIASKGTYVRTIVHDLGERLGTLAAMNSLVRSRAGAYPLTDTHSFEEVEQARDAGLLSSLLLPTDSLFPQFPRVDLDAYGLKRADSGAFITPEHALGMPMSINALCRVYFEDCFLMLGVVKELDRGGLALFVHKNFR